MVLNCATHHKLAFDENVKSFDKKAKAKLKARVVPYIALTKKEFTYEFLFSCTIQLLTANMDDSKPF